MIIRDEDIVLDSLLMKLLMAELNGFIIRKDFTAENDTKYDGIHVSHPNSSGFWYPLDQYCVNPFDIISEIDDGLYVVESALGIVHTKINIQEEFIPVLE